MRSTIICILVVLLTSCIPTKIAPKIESYKITTGKKFNKALPKWQSFIFEDPKNANEFYNYINTKFKLNHNNVDSNVKIVINNTDYYLSFYEIARDTETLNLIPIVIDGKRNQNGNDALLSEAYTSQSSKYYIALTVFDDDFKNCLKEDYKDQKVIIQYLEALRKQYLSTYNYQQLLLKKTS